MLHTHLLFPSRSHASPFLFPSRTNTLRSRTVPAISVRRDSSSLRFRSHDYRILNSAENDVVSETGHSKQPVNRAYPFHEIEPKWQRFWKYNRTFRTPDDDIDTSKPKYYVLDMFTYPRVSVYNMEAPINELCGKAGLHVGHPPGYTATDILARYKRMQGYIVLHSMGWDAFGLPAEQNAIETGTHPKLTTLRNINRFRTQPMRQWILKITAYADRLLEDLDDLDWPESVKEMQRNWIGRSEGAEMEFCILDSDGKERDIKIIVYTTRPDTIFGATYLFMVQEHPLLSSLVSIAQSKHVEDYVDLASRKSDLERTELQKEKTGVFIGCYAKNPANREAIPVWVADYVLGRWVCTSITL